MTSLSRFTLLNTRPQHQAEVLSELVKHAGGKALNCPTLAIQWGSQKALRACLTKELEQYDKVILTSVNAVEGILKSHLKAIPSIE
ncbi:MAG: uroporphyrinogen-III synthase, partial [Pseudomonadota bacterium]